MSNASMKNTCQATAGYYLDVYVHHISRFNTYHKGPSIIVNVEVSVQNILFQTLPPSKSVHINIFQIENLP